MVHKVVHNRTLPRGLRRRYDNRFLLFISWNVTSLANPSSDKDLVTSVIRKRIIMAEYMLTRKFSVDQEVVVMACLGGEVLVHGLSAEEGLFDILSEMKLLYWIAPLLFDMVSQA